MLFHSFAKRGVPFQATPAHPVPVWLADLFNVLSGICVDNVATKLARALCDEQVADRSQVFFHSCSPSIVVRDCLGVLIDQERSGLATLDQRFGGVGQARLKSRASSTVMPRPVPMNRGGPPPSPKMRI